MDADECWYDIDNGKPIEIDGFLYYEKRPFYGICFRTRSDDSIEIIENYDANYLINDLKCETVTLLQEAAEHILSVYQALGRCSTATINLISVLEQ